MSNQNENYETMPMILENEPQLYDLHTHLLGMGNVGFWVDTILMDEEITPTHETFSSSNVSHCRLCPLIWDKCDHTGFVAGKTAAKLFPYLINEDILSNRSLNEAFEKINDEFKSTGKIFCELFQDKSREKSGANFELELQHHGLSFKNDFSYDIILTLSDLAKGLGVNEKDPEDIVQMKVADKLGIYLSKRETQSQSSDEKAQSKISFKHWIIFNAREQLFQVVYGIQVKDLRYLIKCDPNAPNEAKKIARAYINNAVSMCNIHGTSPHNVDFHTFRGNFTPEFYPRRFALKDSLYSQRLDILVALIYHVLRRYQVCLPPVKYCEFSVGVGDLSRPWVFDILRSIPVPGMIQVPQSSESANITYRATPTCSSFAQCVREGFFPHLKVAFMAIIEPNRMLPSTPTVNYKFLAGFDRKEIAKPIPNNQEEALTLLYESPQRAIVKMIEEMKKSDKKESSVLFSLFVEKLKKLERNTERRPSFYKWMVGIDLFGDELGYPYCPFIAHSFIEYINKPREENDHFGVRIHCGENVLYADIETPGYRLFIAHMYIVFRCLQFLQRRLNKRIRIGHGIAFERILGETMSSLTHRKSAVLLAEMRHNAKELFKNIAFEVNITSNEYLLGDILRQGDFAQTHRLDALFKLNAPIILATDDDGIWPLDRCSSNHPGHHSLAAEYCRAITSSIIKTPDQLKKILDDTKKFCFFQVKEMSTNDQATIPRTQNVPDGDREQFSNIVMHPDIIIAIMRRLTTVEPKWPFYKNHSKSYRSISDEETWNRLRPVAQVAYICYSNIKEPNDEYNALFPEDNSGKMFAYVKKIWEDICSQFINGTDQNEGVQEYRHVFIDSWERFSNTASSSGNDPSHTFISPQNNNDPLPTKPNPLFTCLKDQCQNSMLKINLYTGRMNLSTLTEDFYTKCNEQKADFKNLSLTIYMNQDKNKYKYYKSGNLLKLQVNPNPTNRDKTQEKYVYVICNHAGAATAALHKVIDQISTIPRNTENQIVAIPSSQTTISSSAPLGEETHIGISAEGMGPEVGQLDGDNDRLAQLTTDNQAASSSQKNEIPSNELRGE